MSTAFHPLLLHFYENLLFASSLFTIVEFHDIKIKKKSFVKSDLNSTIIFQLKRESSQEDAQLEQEAGITLLHYV